MIVVPEHKEDECMMIVSDLIKTLRDMPDDALVAFEGMAFTRSRATSIAGRARMTSKVSSG
jgi:hypothetical protein